MVAGREAANGAARNSPPIDIVTTRKDPAMDQDLIKLLRPGHAGSRGKPDGDLITCSVCLRVLRSSEWIEAERVIREIRSFELEAPPPLLAGTCDVCADSIRRRRARAAETAAAWPRRREAIASRRIRALRGTGSALVLAAMTDELGAAESLLHENRHDLSPIGEEVRQA
jgi:hypothetical protein